MWHYINKGALCKYEGYMARAVEEVWCTPYKDSISCPSWKLSATKLRPHTVGWHFETEHTRPRAFAQVKCKTTVWIDVNHVVTWLTSSTWFTSIKLWGLYWQTDRQTDRRREVGWTRRQNGQLVFWRIGKLFISGMRCEGRKSQHLCTAHYRWSMRTLVSGYHQAKNNTNGDDSFPPPQPPSQAAPPHLKINMSVLPRAFDYSGCFQFFMHFFLSNTFLFVLFFCFFHFLGISGNLLRKHLASSRWTSFHNPVIRHRRRAFSRTCDV